MFIRELFGLVNVKSFNMIGNWYFVKNGMIIVEIFFLFGYYYCNCLICDCSID